MKLPLPRDLLEPNLLGDVTQLGRRAVVEVKAAVKGLVGQVLVSSTIGEEVTPNIGDETESLLTICIYFVCIYVCFVFSVKQVAERQRGTQETEPPKWQNHFRRSGTAG